MGQRLADTARAVGVAEAGVGRIGRAFALAMEPRRAQLPDEHDPAYLHPGRCPLICMEDLEMRDVALLAASTLIESERSELAVPPDRILAELGAEVAELVAEVPASGSDELAEILVVARPGVRMVALAERLDQLRHAHLWADPDRKRAALEEATRIYLPVAQRTDAVLERRYRWWCAMFGRRHL